MARKQGDSESGKLGNKIYYTWHGRQCERSMPTSVANPQTEAQQAHRSNFAMVSKLSSYMKEAHLIGLHWHAIREHNSTYAIFRQLNKDCFTPDGEIDLPRIIVSRGSVERVEITSASIDDNVLTVTFDSRAYGGKATDVFFLFVYCPALCTGRLATPVLRSAGLVTAVLPPEWLNPTEPTPPKTFRQSLKQTVRHFTSTLSSAPPALAPPTPSTSRCPKRHASRRSIYLSVDELSITASEIILYRLKIISYFCICI